MIGFSTIAALLATAIPLGIYNFTEGMNNVESAAAAGDNYPLRSILLADGIGAIVGSFLGQSVPAGGVHRPSRAGRPSAVASATRWRPACCVALVCWLGLAGLLLAIIPLVAILPILLYIGLVIGAQAFQASPARHAPAVVLALLPNIANWGQSQVETALATAGTNLTPDLQAKLSDGGAILYHGMVRFGGGATLAGLMLGAIAVFIIDSDFRNATVFALGAAVLSFFGLIHGAQVGIAVNLDIVVGYVLMAAITGFLAIRKPAEEHGDDGDTSRGWRSRPRERRPVRQWHLDARSGAARQSRRRRVPGSVPDAPSGIGSIRLAMCIQACSR